MEMGAGKADPGDAEWGIAGEIGQAVLGEQGG